MRIIVQLCMLLVLFYTAIAFPSKRELACEGHGISLLCPGEEVVKVQEVMYGRQNSETCVTNENQMHDTDCLLSSAFDVMSNLCNNKSVCNVEVSSAAFQDPCPGTHKYLTVQYTCIKFMFKCHGPFNGFKQSQVLSTDLLPQAGVIVQDPLSNLKRVYFAAWSPGQNQIKEYQNIEEFSMGISRTTYMLHTALAVPNFVVYDSNLYYAKEGSCNIVKYGLMLRRRLHEISVGVSTTDYACDINLASDEYGIWAVYKNNQDNLVISKIDPQNLQVLSKFVLDFRYIPYLHKIVVLCGVMYVVGSQTHKVEYQFNTNFDDKPSQYIPKETTEGSNFIKLVNITSLSYNPRSKEIHAWNSYSSRTFVYTMYYAAQGTGDETVVTFETVVSDVSPQMLPVVTTNEVGDARTSSPVPQTDDNHCPSVYRHGILWPTTKVGLKAIIGCPLGVGENGTWECVRDLSLRKSAWHIAGPNLDKCATWVTDIQQNFERDRISSLEAIEDLQVSLKNRLLDVPHIPQTDATACIILANNLLKAADVDNYEENLLQIKTTLEVMDMLIANLGEEWNFGNNFKFSVIDQLTTVISEAISTYNNLHHTTNNKKDDISFHYTNFAGKGFCQGKLTTIVFPEEKLNGSKSELTATTSAKLQLKDIKKPSTYNCSVKSQLVVIDNLLTFVSNDLDANEETWKLSSRPTFVISKYDTPRDDYMLTLTMHHKQKIVGDSKCAVWEQMSSDGYGFWNDNVCEVVSENTTHTTCDCDKTIGLFMLLTRPTATSASDLALAVTMVTVGLAFCTLCVVVCLIATFCNRDYHGKEASQKHLLVCLLLTEVSFLVGSHQTQNPLVCTVMSGILQFFLLALFLWVTLDAVQLYVMYVKGASTNKSICMVYTIIAYGIPLAAVAVSAIVDFKSFTTSQSCWLNTDSHIVWVFVAPLCLVVFVNMTMLSTTLYKMCKHRLAFAESSRPQTVKMMIRGTSLLLSLLSFNWSFGMMWLTERSAIIGYLFAIFNTFQGLFIVLFRCIIPLQTKQPYTVPFFGLFTQSFTKTSFNKKSYAKRYQGKEEKNQDIATFNNHVVNSTSKNMDYKW